LRAATSKPSLARTPSARLIDARQLDEDEIRILLLDWQSGNAGI
jgi:hypothetical protein